MNPGSRIATDAGCTCPVMDNYQGSIEAARARGGWWIFSDCPLHGTGGSHPAEIPPQDHLQVVLDPPEQAA